MKTLKRITLITSIISVLYLAVCLILPHTQYSWRMWAGTSGKLLTALVLPLLCLLMAGVWLWKRNLHVVVKIIFSVVEAAAYGFWGFWVLVFLIFTIQEEKRLTPHLLVANESEFLGPAHYEYYYPAAFFFRIPGELTDEIKAEYLEEKYGPYVEVFPELDIRVRRNGMELEDNFTECVTAWLGEQGIADHRIERDFFISRSFEDAPGFLYLELEGEEDIEEFASMASGLIRFIMEQTDFFEENRGVLYFYCGEGEDRITGNIPFGKLYQWDRLEPEYYLDEELVAERIRDEYEDELRFRERLEADRKRIEEQLAEAETGDMDDALQEVENTDCLSVEESAEIVYEAMLAGQGYVHTPCYNAKGNFYLDLGEHPTAKAEEEAGTGYDRYTLVYDRRSKNGKCELFVLYREHYTEGQDGGRDLTGTAILDIYAVEISTEKVISSGRTAWSDPGTPEYREMTGE